MSRGRKALPLSLNEEERRIIRTHLSSRGLNRAHYQRLQILLWSSEGKSLSSISRDLGLSRMTVRSWRDRFATGLEALRIFAQGVDGLGVSDRVLFERILSMLSDRPRPGTPPRILPAQVQQIVALACKKPADYGLPHSSWTHQLLAEVAISEGIVKQISGRYVGILLKKAATPSAQE